MTFKKILDTLLMPDLRDGLKLTWGYFFRDTTTVQYPTQKRHKGGEFGTTWGFGDRFRGMPVLRRHPDTGKERCIACNLCVSICPNECLSLTAIKNPDGPGKYPQAYGLKLARCLFCGLCAEVCPTDAIVMSKRYELAVYTREETYFDKEQLLELGKPEY